MTNLPAPLPLPSLATRLPCPPRDSLLSLTLSLCHLGACRRRCACSSPRHWPAFLMSFNGAALMQLKRPFPFSRHTTLATRPLPYSTHTLLWRNLILAPLHPKRARQLILIDGKVEAGPIQVEVCPAFWAILRVASCPGRHVCACVPNEGWHSAQTTLSN